MSVRPRAIPAAGRAVVAILFAALFFFGLQAPAAYAAGPVTFTITLTSKTGAPIAAANVYAYPITNPGNVSLPDESLWKIASPVSGKPGQYRFEDGAGGDQTLNSAYKYAFFFDSPSSVTTAFDQFYGSTTFIEDARLVQPTGSNNSLSVSLGTNATITGSVKNSSSKGIAGVTVYPWRWVDGDWFPVYASGVTTSSTGAYALRNLEPGSYRLEFDAGRTGYLSEFSGNTTVFGSAAGYFAALGSSQAVNASLSAAGTLSGTLALQDLSGDPIEASGLIAWAYPVIGAGNAIDPGGEVYPSNVTTAAGTWSIRGLPAGPYVVRFEDLINEYRPEWSVNQDSRVHATAHVVTLGKTTTAAKTTLLEADPTGATGPDTSLDLLFTYNSARLIDAEIFITSDDGFFLHLSPDDAFTVGYQVSGDPGHYFIRSLDPGTYDIFVDPADNAITPYSTSITVNPAPGTQDVHAALASGGGMSFTTPATVGTSATELGTSYTVTPGAITGSTVEFSYQWMHDLGQGPEPIAGATGAVYASKPADVGHELSVLVRADRRGVDPAFQRLVVASPVTPGDAPDAVSLPSISGPATPLPGQAVSAVVGDWQAGAEAPKFEYTWVRNPGTTNTVVGTARTYTLVPADAGQTIALSVTASAAGHAGPTTESGGTIVAGYLTAPKVTKNPTITTTTKGQPAGSVRYALSSSTWSPSGTGVTYSWYANGVFISGATASSLVCTVANCPAGTTIEATVYGTKLGYAVGQKTFLVRRGSVPPVVTPGTVATLASPGTALDGSSPVVYGQTLRAQPPVLGYPYASGGTVKTTYQWQSSANGTTWSSIKGQTAQNYVVPSSMAGKRIRVHVTVTSTLAGTYVVDLPTPGVPIIAKQDLVNAVGTVNISMDSYDSRYGAAWLAKFTGTWPVTGLTTRYQWYRCDALTNGSACDDSGTLTAPWVPISRATAATYTPPASLDGFALAVRATVSKTGYATAALISGAAHVGGAANGVFILGAPTISGAIAGDAKIAVKLTARYAAADVPGAKSTGRWEYCSDACSSWTQIPGATALSYTPQPFLAGLTSPRIRFDQFVTATVGGTPYANNQASASVGIVVNSHSPSKAPTASWNATTHTGTVKPGTWAAGTTFSYAWHAGDMVTGGDSPTLTDNSGKPVWVVMTAHRLGYADRAYTFYLFKPLPAIASSAVFGTPDAQYGAVLDVDQSALFALPIAPASPAPVYKYQWYSGSTAIKGQTGATFTPSTAYIGKAIKVRVTVSSAYFGTRSAYATPLTVQRHAAGSLTATFTSPTGTGPGSKLTAVPMTSYPSGTKYAYKWQRLDGAVLKTLSTSSIYTVTSADAGKPLILTMTATRTGWLSATATTNSSFGYGDTLAPLAPVTLAPAVGDPTPGKTLAVSAAWNTSSVLAKYTWYLNGQVVPGVTGASWAPPANAWGANIQVGVELSKAGWQTQTYLSNHVVLSLAPVATPTTHPVVAGMTGTGTPRAPVVGNVLSATTGAWTVDGLTFSYVWKVDGVAVAGETSSTYSVRFDDIGKPIAVEVRAGKRGWTEALDVVSVASGKPVQAAP